jgi:AAA15 family ATPase/GTPase
MLKNITIENFRCFKHTKISGFSSVNLIGGQNNAGKTALLEALAIASYPEPSSIENFRRMRDVRNKNIATDKEKVWDQFFFELNNQKVITLTPEFRDKGDDSLTIACANNLDEIKSELPEIIALKQNELFRKLSNNFFLSVAGKIAGKDFHYFLNPDAEKNAITQTGQVPWFRGESDLPFIASTARISLSYLLKAYSNIKQKGKIQILHDTLRLVDDRVSDTEIDAPGGGEPILKIILKNGQRYMLTAFGDGMVRIFAMVLLLLDTPRQSIFIDEIENGLHYTKHRFFWQKVFEIAKELEIQVFATSHSLEMIKAFNEAALEGNHSDKARYFEMTRHAQTNEIFANTMHMDDLEYEITKNLTFRGE